MPQSHSRPTRSLPNNPSLGQLRKQAKELLRGYRDGDPKALAEVERFERNPDSNSFSLTDAQRVLARSYGFSSWTKLKHHVEGVTVKAFCDAANAGDVAIVRKLATVRPELVNMSRGGEFGARIALHFAVLNRDAKMTAVLMELGSDARRGVWPHRDATAAYTIARERGYDDVVTVIEKAEKRRRRVLSAPDSTISSKTNDVHQAILEGRADDARRILENELSLVGACDVRGATPLHVASWVHDPVMVAWLLQRHAPVNARDGDGKTPLDTAAFVAGWSSHGKDFCFLENSRVRPERFDETVQLLRSAGATLTPRAAVAIGDADSVRRMHRDGRLPNEVHVYRGGLLSIAVRVNRLEMVRLLLDLGLDPDETTVAGDGAPSWGMPLWFAAMCGRHEIAQLLLSRNADVNAVVYACGDSLYVADGTGDEKMISLLIRHGARLTVERVAGSRDLATAQAILEGRVPAQSLNVAEPTLTDLAEQMLWAAGSCDPGIVRLCLPHVSRKGNDPWWNYVLMHATLPESFQLVLEHGVDPDVRGEGGYTMLHHLAAVEAHANPKQRQISEEQRLQMASLLLDLGATPNIRDPLLKSTPLGWACRWGRLELVRLLLDRGGDPEEPDAEPWATPISWAKKGGHLKVIELLE